MAAAAEVRHLPTGRLLAVDERGVGLRATWHLDRGLVNLSLWRDDHCVEAFHLSIEDAGRLTGFLVDGFAQAAATVVPSADAGYSPAGVRASAVVRVRDAARRAGRSVSAARATWPTPWGRRGPSAPR
jgi:hypothetical protein